MARKTNIEIILKSGRSVMVTCDEFTATHLRDGTLTRLSYTGMTRPASILYTSLDEVAVVLEHPSTGPVEVPGDEP